jgi:phage terminase large subunit-like protein
MTLPELREMHATAWRGIFKRPDALLLETTTAYRPGQGSIAESAMETYKHLDRAAADRLGVLYDHRGAPCAFDDLQDPSVRMAALLDAYGPAAQWMPLEELVAAWDLPDTDQVEWARYWANMVVVSADSFIDPAEWAGIADPAKGLAPGDAVCLALDTSIVDDGTALVACRVSDGHLQRLGYWQKPEGREGIGWFVPYDQVDAAVRAAFDQYRVLRLYCDPQHIGSYLDDWELAFGSGHVFKWPTNRAVPMASALQRFYVALKTGGLSHDGDGLLAKHIGNARTWMSQGRTLIRKDRPHSPNKIDLAMAAVLALEAAADARLAGEDREPELPRRRRAWSF